MTLLSSLTRLTLTLALTLAACADSDSEDANDAPEPATARANAVSEPPENDYPGCTRGTLEDDLQTSPLMGRAVTDGALAPGDYIVSTTYLQIKPDKNSRLGELLGPVMTDLGTRDGLLALAFANSPHCNTARTLAAWRDDTAMLEFVVGDAHAAAMAAARELNRGGSATTHWSGSDGSVRWDKAAEELAKEIPRRY